MVWDKDLKSSCIWLSNRDRIICLKKSIHYCDTLCKYQHKCKGLFLYDVLYVLILFVSTLMFALYCLDYHSFIVSFKIVILNPFNFILLLQDPSDLPFQINFKNILTIPPKKTVKILTEITMNL